MFNTDHQSLSNLDNYLGRVAAADKEVGVFRRQYVHVEIDGELAPILTHVGNKLISSKGEKKVAPSKEYMDLLIKGAEEQGLSPGYIDELRTYKKILTIPMEED